MDSFLQWLASSPPATWVQALGTPIIGLVAAYVAYQSARTARNKLKYDMFEKRLQVYREISQLLSEALNSGFCSFGARDSYRQLQAQAKFLFSDAVIDSFLKEASEWLPELSPALNPTLDPNDHEEFELELARREIIMEWQFGDLTGAGQNHKELQRRHPWLAAIAWLSDHAGDWDKLTLPYLRLAH